MDRLRHAKFKVLGEKKHTAVKLCHWTKTSIKTGEENYCYKQKFYGIKSHRCLQMTPAVPFCNFGCQFCWRDITQRSAEWKGNYDNPEKLEELIQKSALPTQLYVSVYGCTKEILYEVAHPIIKDTWERLNKTIELLPKLNTRKVCRLTL